MVIGLMTLVLICWGIWSATKLPIDAVPDITNNQVQIITVCPSLAGQEVEQLVTFPIEQSITYLPGLKESRSISRFGLSVITAVFNEDVDIYFARQLVNEKLKEAVENIPEGIGTPELGPVSTGLSEVYQYLLYPASGSEDKYSAMQLRTMQDWIVARQLNGIKGIAEISSFGGALKQYEVSVDPNRLKAMGVSITDIFNALENNNQNAGGAYIDEKPNAYFIRGKGRINSLEDIRNIAIKNTKGAVPLFIKDVAKVQFGSAIRYGALTYNGKIDAVGGVVLMLKGENSNEVVRRIKEKIPVIQKSLPNDVIIKPFLDRTELVGRTIHTVEKNLIEGALIVIFVLVLFLGNMRAGLIVASAIPLSLLFALGMMKVFGVSANLMSLGAIDFGLIVDGAVIIVEATLHHLGLRKSTKELSRQEMDREVFSSASKIRKSAAFGEIIILIVYIPILTLTGIEGKMFSPMAMTVGFAILGALILSLTYIPMMCALFLSRKPSTRKTFSDKMMLYLRDIYQPLLQKAIQFKYAVVAATILLFVISLYIFRGLGGEFIPQLQEGNFAFHCILPQGSSLSQSIETSMHASRILKKFDEVEMVVGKTGTSEVPTDPMPPEATDLIIVLHPKNEWEEKKSYDELADEMIEALQVIPGVFFEKNQPIQMRFNELMTGIKQDVAVKIFGENPDSLSFYAEKVSAVISNVEGTTEPRMERVKGLRQIHVAYDRMRLANYGVNVEEVNDVLTTAFAGRVAGQVFEEERRFDLVVRLDSAHRNNIDDVSNLMVPTGTGIQIPMSQLARVSYELGPAQISHEAGKRRIVIGFNVSGRDVQSVVNEIQQKLDEQITLPTGYYFTYGGQFENLREARNRLMVAVPLSLLLIFILLYFTFNSIKQATLIFTAIPMSAIGGVFALLLRDMPFSISAGIGFIALFGVAVLNGIVLIGTFNQLQKDGVTDAMTRIFMGTRERLRPVLMTATVASLGFLPMAISTSAGAEVQKPLATVVIGGLITATFLTLFVLPMLYIIFHSKFKFRKNIKMKTLTTLLLLLVSGTISPSFAQKKKTIGIDEAISLAVKNNGNILAENLEIQAAKSKVRTAGTLPKLELGADLGHYNSIPFDQSYQASQTIPFPTIFGARKQLYKEMVTGKELEQRSNVLELKKQVRTYYYNIQYMQHYQNQLHRLDSLYADFINIAMLRYQAGDIKKVEISTAKAKKGEIALQLKKSKALLNQAYQDLQAIINTDEPFEIIIDDEFQILSINAMADYADIARHPAIMRLYQQAKILELNSRLQKAQNLPEFTIGYTNQSLIGFHTLNGQEQYFNLGDRFDYISIGIGIPLSFGANKSAIESLAYQKQAALAHAQQQERMLETQLNNAILKYQLDRKEFQYYQKQALHHSGEIISAAQLGYRTGDISYVEYLYALQTVIDIRLGYLKSIQSVNQSVINIYFLIKK